MRYVSIRNTSTQVDLGSKVGLADKFLLRARGLIARPKLKEGEGLLVKPCQALRMTRFTQVTDVVMVGPGGRVLALYPKLEPGEKTEWHASARYALQLAPGTISRTDTRVGDEVSWGGERTTSGPASMNGKGRPEPTPAKEVAHDAE